MDQPAVSLGPSRWSRFKDATAFWRAPAIAGVTHRRGRVAGLVLHQSTLHNGKSRRWPLTYPGGLAGYINLPALASRLAIGGGFATFTGGYNIVMLNKVRQRADDACKPAGRGTDTRGPAYCGIAGRTPPGASPGCTTTPPGASPGRRRTPGSPQPFPRGTPPG